MERFLSTVSKGDFALARAGWIGDYVDPHTFLQMWRSGDGLNMTGWKNEIYDESLSKAENSKLADARWEHFQTCEDLLKEAPILPLYFMYIRLHPTVKGWYPTLLTITRISMSTSKGTTIDEKTILSRFLQAIPTLWVIATLTFFMTRFAPEDP